MQYVVSLYQSGACGLACFSSIDSDFRFGNNPVSRCMSDNQSTAVDGTSWAVVFHLVHRVSRARTFPGKRPAGANKVKTVGASATRMKPTNALECATKHVRGEAWRHMQKDRYNTAVMLCILCSRKILRIHPADTLPQTTAVWHPSQTRLRLTFSVPFLSATAPKNLPRRSLPPRGSPTMDRSFAQSPHRSLRAKCPWRPLLL